MFWILLILIFIRPFVSSLAFPYIDLVISCALIISLFIWFIQQRSARNKLKILRIPFTLYIVGLFLTTVFSAYKIISLFEFYKYGLGLLLFFFGFSLDDKNKKSVLQIIIWAGTIISLLALYQYFRGFHHVLAYVSGHNITNPFILEYLTRKRVFFPFVTPNILGGYLAMIIPLALAFKKKIFFLLPLFGAILLTASAGAFLSMCLGVSIYYLLTNRFNKRTLIILASIFSAGAVLIIITRVMTHTQHHQLSFSTSMRFNYWKETLELIKQFPLTGVGPGNFNLQHSRFTHNSFLQIWAELGIITLIGFIWLNLQIFISAIKKILQRQSSIQYAALMASCSIFLIHNLIDFSFFLPEVASIWWVLLGMLFVI